MKHSLQEPEDESNEEGTGRVGMKQGLRISLSGVRIRA